VSRRRFFAMNHAGLHPEALSWFNDDIPVDHIKRNEWIQLLAQFGGGIALHRLVKVISRQLLQLGINPGGTSYELMRYFDEREFPWHNCYEWNTDPIQNKSQLTFKQERLLEKINDALMGEIMYAIFPH